MRIFFKPFIFAILTCSSLVYGAPAAKDKTEAPEKLKWETFKSETNGFSVMLPKAPEHVQQKIEIPQTDLSIDYDTYISEPNASTVYVISVWNYPEQIDMSKPEVNLQDGFGGMISALPGSQVLNMRMDEMGDFKTLEFLVKNEDIYFQGKLILVHNTLYQVFSVYKDSVNMTNDYNKFIESFKLINPNQHKVAPKANTKKMSV